MRLEGGLVLAIVVVLAGCSAPGADVDASSAPEVDDIARESVTGSPGAVGGSVGNSAPVVQALSPSATTGENRGGFAVVFSGTVFDANAEAQLQNVSIRGTGPSVSASDHVVTTAERDATSAPAEFGTDGWKVWTATKRDGILHFQYRYTFPAFSPPGVHSFQVFVADKPGLSGASSLVAVTLTSFSDITISPTPVDASGAGLAGQNWGQWSAQPGASNVESANYIELVNTGDLAGSSVVIDLANEFTGAEDPSFVIPTAGNVQFAWAEAPASAAPSTLTFAYLPANADASVTVDFSAKGNVIYVTYRIVQLPQVLPVQSYGISFTVTEL